MGAAPRRSTRQEAERPAIRLVYRLTVKHAICSPPCLLHALLPPLSGIVRHLGTMGCAVLDRNYISRRDGGHMLDDSLDVARQIHQRGSYPCRIVTDLGETRRIEGLR